MNWTLGDSAEEGIKIRQERELGREGRDKENHTWTLDLRIRRRNEKEICAVKKATCYNWNAHQQVVGWDAPWQSHSCGAISGVSFNFRKRRETRGAKWGTESHRINREEEGKKNYEMIQKTWASFPLPGVKRYLTCAELLRERVIISYHIDDFTVSCFISRIQ